MFTRPPDFTEGYPSAGEKIGPAWAHLWHGMRTDVWQLAKPMIEEAAELYGVAPSTIANLLRQARQRRILEVRYKWAEDSRHRGPKPPAWYRAISKDQIRYDHLPETQPGLTGPLPTVGGGRWTKQSNPKTRKAPNA